MFFSIFELIPSMPEEDDSDNDSITFKIPLGSNTNDGMMSWSKKGVSGNSLTGSLVKTELKVLFRISATSCAGTGWL